MTEWTPIAKAKILPLKKYWCTWKSGAVSREHGNVIGQNIVAVMDYVEPEPYVPPKPKRREWWIVKKPPGVGDDAYPCRQFDLSNEPVDQVHVREVLPDDLDPEVLREVIKEMREQSVFNVTSNLTVRSWINRLESKP